ncbi:MAG: tRNA preQ1(34) S-adenosylmethionine ribosyltransferase-isomerase QueA [Acidobacteriota bacterium]
MTLVSSFDFDLPESLIAQEARPRGTSRLLVVDRAAGTFVEHPIAALPRLLKPGDRLVANDTRVFPARLIGTRLPGGGAGECFLLERAGDDQWLALVHPGQRLRSGSHMVFEDAERAPGVRLRATILDRRFFGRRLVQLVADGARDVDDAVDRLGHIPLPPYIKRGDRADDRERYQTVYARARGSVAAPTAGLHFDAAMLEALGHAGIDWTPITLHVGYGTFKPVRVDVVEDHVVDPETYTIEAGAASAMADTRRRGHRVIAVGTTTTRALESAAAADGTVQATSGATDLFIRPGHVFRAIDGLFTNFHLPKSSLLMLVAAFAGHELTMEAYRHAVREEFHFYSYGDAMLVV